MGLFGAVFSAIKGKGNIKKGGQSDTSKPFHTHSSESKKQNTGAAPSPSMDPVSLPEPSFMGKNQVDDFKTLTDPLSVDRGGRTVSQPDGLDNVGIEPAMNPAMATPVDIDQQGVNKEFGALYSNKI